MAIEFYSDTSATVDVATTNAPAAALPLLLLLLLPLLSLLLLLLLLLFLRLLLTAIRAARGGGHLGGEGVTVRGVVRLEQRRQRRILFARVMPGLRRRPGGG